MRRTDALTPSLLQGVPPKDYLAVPGLFFGFLLLGERGRLPKCLLPLSPPEFAWLLIKAQKSAGFFFQSSKKAAGVFCSPFKREIRRQRQISSLQRQLKNNKKLPPTATERLRGRGSARTAVASAQRLRGPSGPTLSVGSTVAPLPPAPTLTGPGLPLSSTAVDGAGPLGHTKTDSSLNLS